MCLRVCVHVALVCVMGVFMKIFVPVRARERERERERERGQNNLETKTPLGIFFIYFGHGEGT